MEQIKEAFSKVKQDMDFLKNEILILNKELLETRKSLIEFCEILKNLVVLKNKSEKKLLEVNPTHPSLSPVSPMDIPAHNRFQNPLNTQNTGISIRNEGVPTDRQTDRQTDQQMDKGSYNDKNIPPQENSIANAIQMLESLDNLKKEIRLKFKRLTEQELLVFSTIYQSSEEGGHADYKTLSEKLSLTESSIRDYIGRLIKKGIPVEKVKINNKTVHLFISPNLKKIASLSTILQLRNI